MIKKLNELTELEMLALLLIIFALASVLVTINNLQLAIMLAR